MTQFVRKLVSTFGIGLEQSGLAMGGGSGPLSHEALAKRAQAAAQDPAFQRLKAQFANDFDFRLELEVTIIMVELFMEVRTEASSSSYVAGLFHKSIHVHVCTNLLLI